MKRSKLLISALLLIIAFAIQNCGPIVVSSAPDTPPPPWFYPNRVEVVRYVYFPDYNIYYDISLRHYIYFENDVWITVDILPSRYRHIDLRSSRYVRIRDYHGNSVRSYHGTNRYNRSRNSRSGYYRRGTRNSYSRGNRSTRENTRSSRSRSARSRDTTIIRIDK